jgi:hypothetical protein
MLKMSAVGGKAAVVIVMIAAAFLSACGKKVIVGSKDEVRYEGTATKEEAEALGKALKDSGYFQDRGVSVILSKGSEGTIISFVVKDGFWNDQTNVDNFAILGRALAPSVGGLPIKVRLVNQTVETKKEVPVS